MTNHRRLVGLCSISLVSFAAAASGCGASKGGGNGAGDGGGRSGDSSAPRNDASSDSDSAGGPGGDAGEPNEGHDGGTGPSDASTLEGGATSKIFGINHMVYCGASKVAEAATDKILADRIGVDPTQDITEWGSPTSTWFAALRASGARGWPLLNPQNYGNYA